MAVASVKAYLAAGAVAGLLARALLALMVVATAYGFKAIQIRRSGGRTYWTVSDDRIGFSEMTSFFRRFLLFYLVVGRWLSFAIFILLLILTGLGVFNFMARWPTYLVFLFFFLLGALLSELYTVSTVLYFRRFFEGFRCRLRPPAVCILYKPRQTPPPGLPLPGGTVYGGLFFTAAFILDERAWQHELQHVKDAPIFAAIRYGIFSILLSSFYAFGVWKTPAGDLVAPLLSAAVSAYLLSYVEEFRAYRSEGVALPGALSRIEAGKKLSGDTRKFVFFAAVFMWTLYQAFSYGQPDPSLPPNYVAMAVAGGSALISAAVLRWALGVFTRRLFGIDVGDFLFASFIAGAFLSPPLGLLSTFLFSLAMFGRARDAAVAAAVATLPLSAVLLPGWVLTSALLR